MDLGRRSVEREGGMSNPSNSGLSRGSVGGDAQRDGSRIMRENARQKSASEVVMSCLFIFI